MDGNIVFAVWSGIAYLHVIYLLVKLFPYFKPGYEHYFWLGFWILNPSVLEKKGLQKRKILLVIMCIYIMSAILITGCFDRE